MRHLLFCLTRTQLSYSALVYGRLPFAVADNPFLIEFCALLRPSYELPSAYTCIQKLLPAEDLRVTALEMSRLALMHCITLLVDGWDDTVRRSLYGTLACERAETPVMLGLEDMTGQRGNSEAVLRVVENAMKSMDVSGNQVIAAVSDDPTTMRKYRRLLEEKYPKIIVSESAIRPKQECNLSTI